MAAMTCTRRRVRARSKTRCGWGMPG
jgi:hypothetical protein